eukprot:scaffold6256_cov202-Prasinococcus_capsulatus_cf.AAC.1
MPLPPRPLIHSCHQNRIPREGSGARPPPSPAPGRLVPAMELWMARGTLAPGARRSVKGTMPAGRRRRQLPTLRGAEAALRAPWRSAARGGAACHVCHAAPPAGCTYHVHPAGP